MHRQTEKIRMWTWYMCGLNCAHMYCRYFFVTLFKIRLHFKWTGQYFLYTIYTIVSLFFKKYKNYKFTRIINYN